MHTCLICLRGLNETWDWLEETEKIMSRCDDWETALVPAEYILTPFAQRMCFVTYVGDKDKTNASMNVRDETGK